MNITDLNILGTNHRVLRYPELGGGGVLNSYAGAAGSVAVLSIEVDRPFGKELSYDIFDANGEKDAFNDPLVIDSGFTYVTNIQGKLFIVLEEFLDGKADPTTGTMNFIFQFRSAEEDFGLTLDTNLITLPAPTRSIRVTNNDGCMMNQSATQPSTLCNVTPQPNFRSSIYTDSSTCINPITVNNCPIVSNNTPVTCVINSINPNDKVQPLSYCSTPPTTSCSIGTCNCSGTCGCSEEPGAGCQLPM